MAADITSASRAPRKSARSDAAITSCLRRGLMKTVVSSGASVVIGPVYTQTAPELKRLMHVRCAVGRGVLSKAEKEGKLGHSPTAGPPGSLACFDNEKD